MSRKISPPANQDKLEACLDEYMDRIKEDIRDRATELTVSSFPEGPQGQSPFGLRELTQAVEEFAPGVPFETGREKWHNVLFQYFPPFTLLCFLLAIIFGVLGYVTLVHDSRSTVGSGFLDITKIFAGAIVGSTSATALSNVSRKRR